ncbi:MAG: peptidoglycan-binding protein [Alphaproteobacteria bacterium]|nr:peptidoglycan-binding protein [Alphaproteobacteria bacterium]
MMGRKFSSTLFLIGFLLALSALPAGAGDENRQFVKIVQEMLVDAGYLSQGQDDGHLGTRTREAIKRFQSDQGLKADGRLTPELYELLAKKTRS